MYDMPLYRPPSEGNNLIVQATLGCSFNGCTFCSMYKSKNYQARPLAETLARIDRLAADWPTAHRVFVADGDALVLPMDHWFALLDHLKARLPRLSRISCYATPINLLRKSVDELAQLKERGLSLLYVGIESGSPDILKRIRKGTTPKAMVQGLTRAREAGLKVSATVVLGLGGKDRWQDHIDGTVAVVNQAPLTFLSTLQLYLEPEAEADFLLKYGAPFAFQDDEGILAEQERFVAQIDPPKPVIFRSNHASNALALAGNLPRDRERLTGEIRAAREGLRDLRPAFMRGL
ncbi:radical SAM protein [Magnetospira sp. QH-2]|uniref:radical SAM protein n=1 Tax=Magnetospira sp. (strain QH-2) TaxID=1288970 RepID=UPI0003E81A11|nr:radical SAM protein [Magnetospira sp. QH-2]CCQ75005.1 putative Fe-S oxidoreductase [Magnetospira sp. QH-2]